MLGVRTLIGVITGTKRDKNEDQIAWIRPLAAESDDSWEAVLSPESEFPSRGSIFWPRAAGAKENALIRFHAKENDVKNGGPDEYMAVDSQLAFEVSICVGSAIASKYVLRSPTESNSRISPPRNT